MSESNILSTQPYKGTQDFYPEDMRIRRYIYDTWRDVCEAFGYEEYQTPLLESAELYRAKSGDEVGGTELFTLTDLANRELAIRPEMTPSVTRMVSRRYKQWAKPIRLYNISNFARNERPQRGRNREFVQLNFDIFGEESHLADVEIVWMAIETMEAFGAPDNSYNVRLNSRKIIDSFLKEVLRVAESDTVFVTRLMDKYEKLSEVEFQEQAVEIGLSQDQIDLIETWMNIKDLADLSDSFDSISGSDGVRELSEILQLLQNLGYSAELISFAPGLVRGFDYYDGMIFEVFDVHQENNRSLFGGGRYNGLANIFGEAPFPAVGCAPGDETMALFLESWDLIPDFSEQNVIFVPLLVEETADVLKMAHQLRYAGFSVITGTKQDMIGNALREADQKGCLWIVLFGEEEQKSSTFAVKNLATGEQKVVDSVEEIVEMIQSEDE